MFYGKKNDAAGPPVPSAELLSISVDQDYRGKHHAESLYRQLIDFFRSKNVGRFKIVAGESLAAAHRFYRKMGAQSAGRTEVHKGESSLVYIQEVL
jgi:ribosomal protein S18 acetylase RimI-like enzyme